MSNPQGKPGVSKLSNLAEMGGRVLKENSIVMNWADLMEKSLGQVGRPQLFDVKSLMGDNVTVTRVPLLALQFVRGVNPKNQEVLAAAGDAGASIVGDPGYENRYQVTTGTTAGGEYYIRNTKWMNYQAGYEFRFGGTPRWSHNVTPLDVKLLVGLYDRANGYTLGFPLGETEWGLGRWRSGSLVEFIPKSQFNFDKLDGTGPSGMTLDLTKGNIYQIRSLYFGYGPAILEFSDGINWWIAHVIVYPNTEEDTNITETYLSLAVDVENGANDEEYFIEVASANVSILIDSDSRDVNNRVFTESYNTPTPILGPVTNKPIISFRSKTDIQLFGMNSPKENRILADLRNVFINLSGQNKSGTLILAITPSEDVTGGTFVPKDADTSVLEISTNVTSVDLTNADPVFERAVKKDNQDITVYANPNDLRGLRGGYTATLLYTSQAASTDISLTFGWDEQH